jgi:hypothetical protein
MELIKGTKEYVIFAMTGPAGVDLTQYTLEAALIPDSGGAPQPGDWQGSPAAVWIGKQAALLVDTANYAEGEYMLYGRVTTPVERPFVRSGRLRIGDTR